jgi:uncharacterized protein (TIGR02271 family)
MNTVVGLIESRSEAERVVHDLMSEGFPRDRIHVVAGEAEPEGTESGFRGLLVKLGLLESQRKNLGLPAEHLGYYSEGVRRGGYLVTVEADESKLDQAVDVLEDHGAVNIEERATEWQKSGWSGPAAAMRATAGAGRTTPPSATPTGTGQEARIPVVEEELKVGKRAVQRGGVRVYSHITERPASESIVLREEHVNVERHPADRPLSGADIGAFKEGTIELTETAEEAVAAKEARVVEEVVVSKEATERTQTIEDTVRRTDVEVERLGAGSSTAGRMAAFEDYDADFRRHYSTSFANTGAAYERYAPAYRYGYTLASNPAYAGRDWPTLEAEAHREWEKQHAGTWGSMKNAIHHAWERARGRG